MSGLLPLSLPAFGVEYIGTVAAQNNRHFGKYQLEPELPLIILSTGFGRSVRSFNAIANAVWIGYRALVWELAWELAWARA